MDWKVKDEKDNEGYWKFRERLEKISETVNNGTFSSFSSFACSPARDINECHKVAKTNPDYKAADRAEKLLLEVIDLLEKFMESCR